MMSCNSCHDQDGPFIVDIQTNICLCEECYMYREAVNSIIKVVKSKQRSRKLDTGSIIAIIDSIESSVLDELGLR